MQIKVKRRKEFNREYIPVIICGIILVFMIFSLFLLIKSNNRLVTDLPTIKKINEIEVLYSDFSDGIADKNDLMSAKKEKLKVKMNIIDSYANKGILVNDSRYKYFNGKYVAFSDRYSEQIFVSQFSDDIDFITKFSKTINKKKYEEVYINNVLFFNNKYYIFINGISSKDNIDNIVSIINQEGKILDTKVIESNNNKEIVSSLIVENEIAIITINNRTTNIYYINENLEKTHDSYNIDDDDNNPFGIGQVECLDYSIIDNKIAIMAKRKYRKDNTSYKYCIYVTIGNKDANWVPILNEIDYNEFYDEDTEETKVIDIPTDYEDMYLMNKGIIYKFKNSLKGYDFGNNLHYSLDYDNLNTGIEVKEDEDNKIIMINTFCHNSNMIFYLENNENISVIDVYNETMDLIKRYQFSYNDIHPLSSSITDIYYENNKLIFIYTYGYEDTGLITLEVGE